MQWGRITSAVCACAVVAGCAVVAVGISRAQGEPAAATSSTSPTPSTSSASTPPAIPVVAPAAGADSALSTAPATAAAPLEARPPAATAPHRAAPATSSVPPAVAPTPRVGPTTAAPPVPRRAPARSPAAAPAKPRPTLRPAVARPAGSALPLGYSTGDATKVITVTARSAGSTTATLQAWTLESGGWRKYGGAVTAHVGSDGVGKASETVSRTPAGSFTLTRAFGHNSDPGSGLPYTHTNSSYWWISHAGPYYNTLQTCTSSSCPAKPSVSRGDEHLYYETPYYNYAVVIDYNTRNAPGGVRAGAGSAFFLHVTDGHPTAGCVAIPQSRLVSIMRWLTPSAHPRILIGVT